MKKLWIKFLSFIFVDSFSAEATYLRSKTLSYIEQHIGNGFLLDVPQEIYASPYRITEVTLNSFGGVCYTALHRSMMFPTRDISIQLLPLENLVGIAEALRTGKVHFHL